MLLTKNKCYTTTSKQIFIFKCLNTKFYYHPPPHASCPVNLCIAAGVNFFTLKNAQFELSNGICVLARISYVLTLCDFMNFLSKTNDMKYKMIIVNKPLIKT